MAKIVQSDAAPAEQVEYTFAGVSFKLSGDKSYKSDDPVVLAAAEQHPWLAVERDLVEPLKGAYVEQLSPEDDALSAHNSIANDPEAARKAEAEKAGGEHAQPVAIESGRKQTEAVESGGVAETFAADSTTKTYDKRDS